MEGGREREGGRCGGREARPVYHLVALLLMFLVGRAGTSKRNEQVKKGGRERGREGGKEGGREGGKDGNWCSFILYSTYTDLGHVCGQPEDAGLRDALDKGTYIPPSFPPSFLPSLSPFLSFRLDLFSVNLFVALINYILMPSLPPSLPPSLLQTIFESSPSMALYSAPLLFIHPFQLLIGSILTPFLRKYIEAGKEGEKKK